MNDSVVRDRANTLDTCTAAPIRKKRQLGAAGKSSTLQLPPIHPNHHSNESLAGAGSRSTSHYRSGSVPPPDSTDCCSEESIHKSQGSLAAKPPSSVKKNKRPQLSRLSIFLNTSGLFLR